MVRIVCFVCIYFKAFFFSTRKFEATLITVDFLMSDILQGIPLFLESNAQAIGYYIRFCKKDRNGFKAC